MSRNEARRQKKLAKHKKDRQQRQQQLHKSQHLGMAAQMRRWQSGTIVDSLLGRSIEESGIGEAVIARQAGPGHVAVGLFLVDRYCLGVKNVICEVFSQPEFERLMESVEKNGVFDATPSTVRRFVEDAVAYARDLGFAPHPEYAAGQMIFGDIDPAAADETFEMGNEGKPYFISGPNDSPARIRFVLNTLQQRCGPDGFHYLCEASCLENAPHFDVPAVGRLNPEDLEELEEIEWLPDSDVEPPPRRFG